MPTIDQLEAAQAVADSDEMPVSQNGVARKATRSQVLAGLQPTLALATGQLAGRNSAGSGAVEPITIGNNLTLAGGTLSATQQLLNVAALPAGGIPGAADLVAVGEASGSVAVPYGQFMAGLAGLPGFDISGMLATASGGSVARRISEIVADAVSVEDFGAKGDGVTDDTAALSAAVGSGRPLRFGPRTYLVNGQWTLSQPGTVLIGVPGVTILRRGQQAGNGAWIAVQANNFRADGIIFDANRAGVAVESWGVLVTSLCTATDFHRCAFINAAGASLGSGLILQASDPAMCTHVVRDCEFAGNAAHGIWVQACAGVQVVDCRAHDNAAYGINVDYNDAAFLQKAHLVQVLGNRCWNNQRGIAVGNYNATNSQPATWGNANPDAIAVLVAGNICHDNAVYGIAVSGQYLAVHDNILSNNAISSPGGGGLLANMASSRLTGNMITGTATYGIDCGGSINSDISANHVAGAVFGINCGGGVNVRVAGNFLQDCSLWAIAAELVETDGYGVSFGLACNNLAITGNWISMPTATAGGITLLNGPQNVLIARNDFVGAAVGGGANIANCLWANTDTVTVEGNRFNFSQRYICNPSTNGATQQVVFPDIADEIMITYAPSGVQAMLSNYQAQSYGRVSFVKIVTGGAGYTHASVNFGGAGSGATATAMISNGAIIGVRIVSPGGGYGPIGTTFPVSFSGDGTGAAGTGYAGAPLPEERRLLVRCNTNVRFTRVGSAPLQENWTFVDLDVPADADVEWRGTFGMWRAGRFPMYDFVGSDGVGGSILRSINNADVSLRPSGSGRIRLTSDSEASGCNTILGRGAPEGLVAAPPGSDYRNLNGGAGSTYWVKRVGTGNTGWYAVA